MLEYFLFLFGCMRVFFFHCISHVMWVLACRLVGYLRMFGGGVFVFANTLSHSICESWNTCFLKNDYSQWQTPHTNKRTRHELLFATQR